ncbi:MAG TPA: chorismate mutase [Alphaproteobacteria bacterium]|nr:chorismate mutase [Alphaproteobacteria bacterium]
MLPIDEPLARLRGEIDTLDDAIHDLIVQRGAVVEEIGRLKADTDAPVFRPGREAKVLRHIVARHKGSFPAAALVRIWRELMAGSVSMQGPLSMAVCVPAGETGYCQLARAHFGTVGQLATYNSPGEVISAVASHRFTVGIVPAPSLEDSDPWWRMLVGDDDRLPRVVARLPVTGVAGGPSTELAGMALAFAEPEATGDDRSLAVVEVDDEVSRAAVTSAFGDAGLELVFMDSRADAGGRLILVEIADFVGPGDQRLQKIAAGGRLPVVAIHHLGAYPAPFEPSVLGILP